MVGNSISFNEEVKIVKEKRNLRHPFSDSNVVTCLNNLNISKVYWHLTVVAKIIKFNGGTKRLISENDITILVDTH